jgi:hypothetical protein
MPYVTRSRCRSTEFAIILVDCGSGVRNRLPLENQIRAKFKNICFKITPTRLQNIESQLTCIPVWTASVVPFPCQVSWIALNLFLIWTISFVTLLTATWLFPLYPSLLCSSGSVSLLPCPAFFKSLPKKLCRNILPVSKKTLWNYLSLE